jgi:hypothetical protein
MHSSVLGDLQALSRGWRFGLQVVYPARILYSTCFFDMKSSHRVMESFASLSLPIIDGYCTCLVTCFWLTVRTFLHSQLYNVKRSQELSKSTIVPKYYTWPSPVSELRQNEAACSRHKRQLATGLCRVLYLAFSGKNRVYPPKNVVLVY